jgi:hypothetical protein
MWKGVVAPAPVDEPIVRDAIRIAVRVLLGSVILVGVGNFLASSKGLTQYFAAYQDVPTSIVYAFYCLLGIPLLIARGGAGGVLAFGARPAALAALATLSVGLGSWMGHRLVLASFPLSEDEFLADFDAQILAAGRLFAPVVQEWRSYLDALQASFRLPVLDGTHWVSAYLPMNAAIRAAFDWLGSRELATPVLAAAAVPILYGVCRQLFPDDKRAQLVAVLLFVTSSQFLVTAMTPYAMTAHLTFNLAWLWLALRDRLWAHVATIPVSFIACGLHQVVFHPLFVAPFLVLFWFTGRRRLAIFYAAILAPIGLFWLSYWPIAMNLAEVALPQGGGGLGLWDHAARILAMLTRSASLDTIWLMAGNILRFLTWQNPLTYLLVVVACFAVRSWPRPAYALAGGILLTLFAIIVLLPYQGHGWGYRYLHGTLGSFALLGAVGWRILEERAPQIRQVGPSLLWSSAAFSLALLLPIRAYQAHTFTEPYAKGVSAILAKPADVVVVDGTGIPFATDLVRNDPFLKRRPIVLSLYFLSPPTIQQVCERYRVALYDRTDAGARGFPQSEDPPAIKERYRTLRTELETRCPNLLPPQPAAPR